MCTHTYTLIHRRQPRDTHTLGPTHTDTYTLVHTHQTTDKLRVPQNLTYTPDALTYGHLHTCYTQTHSQHRDTHTHLDIYTPSRHWLTLTPLHTHSTLYDRTQIRTHPDTQGHFMRTHTCGLTTLTRTWMPTRTPTHIPTRSKHTQTAAHMTSVSHTLRDITHRHKPRGWTVQQTGARGRPRPTQTHKVTPGHPAPAPSPGRPPAPPSPLPAEPPAPLPAAGRPPGPPSAVSAAVSPPCAGREGASAAAWPGEGARGRHFLSRLPGL